MTTPADPSSDPTPQARVAWHGGDLHDLLVPYRRGDLTDEQRMTRDQQALAERGGALNQCGSCGTYRADGRPPILHHPGCPETPPLAPLSDL